MQLQINRRNSKDIFRNKKVCLKTKGQFPYSRGQKEVESKKKLYKMNQSSNFLGGSLSNWDNVRGLIQIINERQFQNLIFLKDKRIHIKVNGTWVIWMNKWSKMNFSNIKINKLLPTHFCSTSKFGFKFKSQRKLFYQIKSPTKE